MTNLTNKIHDIYSNFIYKRTYSRFIEEENRRETWKETVDRYADFFFDKISPELETDWCTAVKYMSIQNVMPSMRALWSAGKALEENNLAAFNCLAGETEVLTKEYGIKPIKWLDQKVVSVLTSDKEWVESEVKRFGKQKLNKIKFKLNTVTDREVYATPNHRWILHDGRETITSDLKKGDKIPFIGANTETIETNCIDYRLGVQHGFIYGDGTATYSQERCRGYMIRVCSDIEDTMKWFKEYPVTYPPSANGDPVVMMYGDFAKTHSLKTLPAIDETDSYILGFLRGWFAADGSINQKNAQAGLALGWDELQWLQAHGEKFGFVIQSFYAFPDETNFGRRNKKLYKANLHRSALTENDFLIERKRNNYRPLESYYYVQSVEETEREEEVYCAIVPTTHDFVLGKGLLTGNCAYVAIDHPDKFSEMLYVLMHGTGVGFSVERQFVGELPSIPDSDFKTEIGVHVVDDSKLGWKEAYAFVISSLYAGETPIIGYGSIRPKGARLKTFGGRASGPAPLKELINYTIEVFKNAKGRRLNSLEVHDICCMVANCVVVGGVRRSACISFSNLSDQRMKHAKDGQFWLEHPQRSMANNSIAYTEKPDSAMFMEEWLNLMRSGSGERGIVNVEAIKKKADKFGRNNSSSKRLNPCAEAILSDRGLCNLTEVVIRPEDTKETLKEKIRSAVLLGCLQSTLTYFPNISEEWKINAEEECLLGVSLTGTCDNKLFSKVNDKTKELLNELRDFAHSVASEFASHLGINTPKQVTLVKPSGTVSQLVNCSSGLHPRYSDYYIRRVRVNAKDPVAKLLIAKGIPHNPEVGSEYDTTNTFVFDFPIKSPRGSITKDQWTAIEQLDYWSMFNEYWCDGNPSVTIYVSEDEWVEVGAWVYKNWNQVCGLSFLPRDNKHYELAPYEECTSEAYHKACELYKTVSIDFDIDLPLYEQGDTTTGSQTYACVAGVCEL